MTTTVLEMNLLTMLKGFEKSRRYRILMYLSLALMGLISLIDPPTVLTTNIDELAARTLAGVWLVGGLVCTATLSRGKIDGELVFLPTLAGTFVIFGCVMGYQAYALQELRIFAYGTAMFVLAAAMLAIHTIVRLLADFNGEAQ